ncbi:MAG TPA: hypothetical protein PLP65_03405 [Bacteroidales bacterium]|nr:hypothetical protein [Bacteroidales bacterium]
MQTHPSLRFQAHLAFPMKTILIVILFFFVFFQIQIYGQGNKHNMLCNQWIQFGYKSHGDSVVNIITEDCSKKKCEFHKNGKYTEEMYCLKGEGNWAFNNDSTKFGFELTEFIGQKIDNKLPITFTNLIIKLTSDTLIYGTEGYYGESRTYGHDDLYFVRKK